LPGMSNLTAEISLSKGEKIVRNFAVHIPFQTNPDIYHLKAVADFGDYQEASMDMEAEVLPAYEVNLDAKVEGVYAKAGTAVPLRLNLKSFRDGNDVRFRISVSNLSEGIMTPREIGVVLKKNQESNIDFSVMMPRAGMTTQGVMIVQAELDKQIVFTRKIPLRLTSGPVCYRDAREGNESNAIDDNIIRDMVCLENENLVVRFLPNGTLRDFVLRKTGQDLLTVSDYPIGFNWYTWKRGWSFVRSEQDGESVSAIFQSGGDGKEKPVTMTARLSGNWLDIIFDAGDFQAKGQSFYLMSSPVDPDAWPIETVMYIPLKEKMLARKYGDKKMLASGKDEFSGRWIAVWDKNAKTALGTCFMIPSLKEVMTACPTGFGWNYQIFVLADDVPAGQIRFRLFGRSAVESMEPVIKECEKLQQFDE